jgi:putative metallohydrolase (TIGR04338 family)
MPTRYGRQVDSQRAKVYRGEWAFDAKRRAEGHEARVYYSIEDIREFVDDVCGSTFVRNTWGRNPRVTVRRRHGHRKAHYESFAQVIAIPIRNTEAGDAVRAGWAQTDRVILHEIAHAIQDQCLNNRDEYGRCVAAHGREFARIMVALVGEFIGKQEQKWLKDGYKSTGAKFIKSRGPLTAEQKIRARVILAEARATAIATGRAPAGVAAAAIAASPSMAHARPPRQIPITYGGG